MRTPMLMWELQTVARRRRARDRKEMMTEQSRSPATVSIPPAQGSYSDVDAESRPSPPRYKRALTVTRPIRGPAKWRLHMIGLPGRVSKYPPKWRNESRELNLLGDALPVPG